MIGSALLATVLSSPFELPEIRVDGTRLVGAAGKTVLMKGINLGGWFVEEIWMLPIQDEPPAGSKMPKILDHESLWAVIESRFGKAGVARIRNAWRDNWITEQDFTRIKAIGFNHVRLPFLHTLLDEPRGMARLKTAVQWARNNGLYVLLDMHGAPGGQSREHHTGKTGRNELWTDSSNVEEMARKWARLAKEFRNDTTVFAYDLMNEPMGAPSPKAVLEVHKKVIPVLRKSDPKKPVMVEDGYKGMGLFKKPSDLGWGPTIGSVHFYHFEAKKREDHAVALRSWLPGTVAVQKSLNVPMYAGEFNVEPNSSPETMREVVEILQSEGWSWAIWTYKAFSNNGPLGMWGLVSLASAPEAIDPYTDSEAEIKRKIKTYRSENLREYPGYREALKPVL